jgi:hypothetical protein
MRFGFLEVFELDNRVFGEFIFLTHMFTTVREMVFKHMFTGKWEHTVRADIGSPIMLGSRIDKSGHVFDPYIMAIFIIFE